MMLADRYRRAKSVKPTLAPAKEWIVWAGSPTTQISWRSPRQRLRCLLQRADILVFVDDQVAVSAADGVGHLGMARDKGGGAEQDIFEIDPGAVTLGRFVAGESCRSFRGLARQALDYARRQGVDSRRPKHC